MSEQNIIKDINNYKNEQNIKNNINNYKNIDTLYLLNKSEISPNITPDFLSTFNNNNSLEFIRNIECTIPNKLSESNINNLEKQHQIIPTKLFDINRNLTLSLGKTNDGIIYHWNEISKDISYPPEHHLIQESNLSKQILTTIIDTKLLTKQPEIPVSQNNFENPVMFSNRYVNDEVKSISHNYEQFDFHEKSLIKDLSNEYNQTIKNNQVIEDDQKIEDDLVIEYDQIIEDDLFNEDHEDHEDHENRNILIDEEAWEDSINDNKFYINNKIARIFPIIKNFNNYSKLKIDEDSFSYITVREIADMITKIISYHLLFFNLNPQKITIIDYTAGVGGNVLSFSKYFNYVYGIEIDKTRADYLENNVNVYGFHNVTVINDSSINFNYNEMIKINPNIIFMDPPWGGNDYKNSENLLLSLGEKSIEDLVIDIINIFSDYYLIERNDNLNRRNKLIVLKLPKNYDVEYFYNYINKFKLINYEVKIYLYILNKMIILICELNFLNKVN